MDICEYFKEKLTLSIVRSAIKSDRSVTKVMRQG